MSQTWRALGSDALALVDATAGNETVSLTRMASGRTVTVRRIDSSVNTVTVVVTSGLYLDGVLNGTTTVTTNAQKQFTATDSGFESFGGGPVVSVDADGSLVVDGTTVELGTDSDISGKLTAASNLSDLANAGTARTNLGLGTAATMTPATIAADAALKGTYAAAAPVLSLDPTGAADAGPTISAKIAASVGPVEIPRGQFAIGTAILPASADLVVRGLGAGYDTTAETLLKTSADVSVFGLPAAASTRMFLRDLGITSRNTSDASFLLNMSEYFITYLDSIYVHAANKGLWLHSDREPSTSALWVRGSIFQRLYTAVLIEGAYSAHFDGCNFERAPDGSRMALIIKNTAGANARPFTGVTFHQCHFETTSLTVSGQGVKVRDSHLYDTAILLDESSSYCDIEPASFVQGYIVDLGYNNRIGSFAGTNTRENGLRSWRNQGNVINDSGYRAPTGSELVFFSHTWPVAASLTAATFAYASLTPAALYTSNAFNLPLDAGDVSITTHVPKRTMSNIMCLAVGADGGITVTGAQEVLCKPNLLTNGTFGSGSGSTTGWSTVGSPSAVASGTAGYSTVSGTGSHAYYQSIATKPGNRYMLIAQTLNTTDAVAVDDVWDGGGIRATAQPVALANDPNSAYLRVAYFEANDTKTRISIGNYFTGSVGVRFVAVVDLDDSRLYANRAPQAGTWRVGDFVANSGYTTGGVTGWRCTVAGTPGTWVAVYDQRSDTTVDPFGAGLVATADPRGGWATATWPAANLAIYSRNLQGGNTAVTGFIGFTGTSSGNYDIGVYASSGAGRSAVPASRRASSGSVPMPAAGLTTFALGSTVSVPYGDWIALAIDNTTANIGRYNPPQQGLGNGFIFQQTSAFPLPSSAASLNWTSTNPVLIGA